MAGGRFDIDAYLRRIGAGGPLKPAAPETLSALHEARCAAVPFENLDILLRNRELVVHGGATPSTVAIRDPEHLLHVLAEDFGLWFPAGTRFSRPEF